MPSSRICSGRPRLPRCRGRWRPWSGARSGPFPAPIARAWFHAISDSTRDDLVVRGVPRERIAVIYPGVDAVRYRPDPAVARRQPAALRLHRPTASGTRGSKCSSTPSRSPAASGPSSTVDIAGTGDDRPGSKRSRDAAACGMRCRFHGFVDEADQAVALAAGGGKRISFPQGGMGDHRDGGRGVWHAVAGLRLAGAARLGSRRRDRAPRAARRCGGTGARDAAPGRRSRRWSSASVRRRAGLPSDSAGMPPREAVERHLLDLAAGRDPLPSLIGNPAEGSA